MSTEHYRMLALRSALRLECLGMKRSRSPSAYRIVKQKYGLKGSKKRVFEQFYVLVEKEINRRADDEREE